MKRLRWFPGPEKEGVNDSHVNRIKDNRFDKIGYTIKPAKTRLLSRLPNNQSYRW